MAKAINTQISFELNGWVFSSGRFLMQLIKDGHSSFFIAGIRK